MKYSIPLFELSISKYSRSEVAIRNNRTGLIARKGLKPLKKIEKEFKGHVCDITHVFFSHISQSDIDKMKQLLPKTKLYPN